MDQQNERQNQAILLRLQAKKTIRRLLLWSTVTGFCVLFHLTLLALFFLLLAAVALIFSLKLERKANSLWPESEL